MTALTMEEIQQLSKEKIAALLTLIIKTADPKIVDLIFELARPEPKPTVRELSADGQYEFVHEVFGKIRTMTINGNPWFVGQDISKALGYKNPGDAVIKHVDADDKFLSQNAIGSKKRDRTFINESGLYSLILGSKLPSAKQFKRWVTSEVLPALRKNGTYSMGRAQLPEKSK